MITDPLKDDLNKAHQIKTDTQYQKIGIKLYDIDTAIAGYMTDVILPTLELSGEPINVPLIYGNAERWKNVQKDGYLRDKNGQIQIPLVMFKRNSIEANESLANPLNRTMSYPASSKFSKKHKYDLFSKMTGFTRPLEQYNVTVPDYVTLTYEIMVWTDFTEHMNTILEAFQFATDTYWGDKNGLKFKAKIGAFDTTSEVGDGSQRIIRTSFNIVVNAYLLPEKFNNVPTTEKAFTIKKVVWDIKVDEDTAIEQSKVNKKIPTVNIVPPPTTLYDGGSAFEPPSL